MAEQKVIKYGTPENPLFEGSPWIVEPIPEIMYDRQNNIMFYCSVREMHLGIMHNAGEGCHLGSKGNICNIDCKLCDIFEKHEAHLAKSRKRTEAEQP
jgi:hypothetical protein